MTATSDRAPLLVAVEGLRASVGRNETRLPILRGVDLSVRRGEILGIVGETGAGKSMTARAMLGLAGPQVAVSWDTYSFDGREIESRDEFAGLRGKRIGFVPQHPRGSLNPVFSVGDQLEDAVKRLAGVRGRSARDEAIRLLTRVRISDPERRLGAFPHELSGGMCQRVCIAIALAGRPDLIIADEPTTGLDVTIQAEVLKLLDELIREGGAAGILITHDMAVVSETCDTVAVMYSGRVIDHGPTREIFGGALHPYGSLLVEIAQSLDRGDEPGVIPGSIPAPGENLAACAFAPRCSRVTEACWTVEPPKVERGGQAAYCHNPVPAANPRVGGG